MKKIITLICAVIITAACGANKAQDGNAGHDGYTVLKDGVYGGREQAGTVTITDATAFNSLCAELSIEEIPAVDFAKKNVVAVFMGQKSTGGYSIMIEKMDVKDNTVYLKKKEIAPDADGMATMALSAPYVLVSVPKTDKVVVE